MYAGALERRGRDASAIIEVPADERMLAVQSGTVTLSFGCTGELLGLIDPATARELAEEYIADDDPGKALSAEWRDRVYAAMSAALPGEIMATDPSNAQGCGREDGLGEDEAAELEAAAAEHRLGTVALSEASVAVAVSAAHRGEAFAGAREIIDRIKEEAPIWKKEIEGGKERWVEGTRAGGDDRRA